MFRLSPELAIASRQTTNNHEVSSGRLSYARDQGIPASVSPIMRVRNITLLIPGMLLMILVGCAWDSPPDDPLPKWQFAWLEAIDCT
jgi:hypothetical protein